MQSRTIRTPDDWSTFVAWLAGHPDPYPFRVVEGEGRSLSQNALLHVYFTQISQQREDMTMSDVKGELHRMFGLSIRLRDEQFAWVWEQTGARMHYDQQCKLLASGVLNLSSGMTTKELTEYTEQIEQYAAQQGWSLSKPEVKE